MRAKRICKICGKEYEYCRTVRTDSVFRWQDVACCVEHGNEYFALVAASRADVPVKKTTEVEVTSQTVETKEETDDVEVVRDPLPAKRKMSRK